MGDGNEIGGVRLPEITVPLGTATGWGRARRGRPAAGGGALLSGWLLSGLRQDEGGARGEERSAAPRSRSAIATRTIIWAKLRQAAMALERDGYILAEDVPRIVERSTAAAW